MMRAEAPVFETRPELFGSRNRTAVLVSLRLLEESYPSELAALLGIRLYTVQQILRSLERDAVIVSRNLGRTRRVTLNPRYVGLKPLRDLLWLIGSHDTELQRALAIKRRRPRRPGKPGL
jgi:DNA-binding transcriptional ArsR family regulator